MAFGYIKMNRVNLLEALGFETKHIFSDSKGRCEVYFKLIYSNEQSTLRKYFKCKYRPGKEPEWFSSWIRDGSRYNPASLISFQEVFESLTHEQQEIAIFNLDLLR